MQDTFRHQGLRNQLINELSNKGITDKSVLNAMRKIPRHLFIDNAFDNFAYQDKAFPIGLGQTISQPFTVAFQSQLLELSPYEKVLEIGTGSGYQAAVLFFMDIDVYTIERQKKLYQKTKDFLPKIGCRCSCFYGDGYKGLPNFAPFDKIIVTCGASYVPEELKDQLKIGGKMVVPVTSGTNQVMTLIQKKSKYDYAISEHGNFLFVPMLNNKSDGLV